MKSHTRFRSVSKSVTLSDLERTNGRHFALYFSQNGFGANCIKLVAEARPILSATKCSPGSLVFGNVWLMGDDVRCLSVS